MLAKVLTFFLLTSALFAEPKRPNILWIIPDDMSAHFSCYGESSIQTPHVDSLASHGVKFTNAVVTSPVCSPCRSAFITGMYQTSIGAHHHRSGRGEEKIKLPDHIKLVPALFQEAGYYTSLSGWPMKPGQLGKADYNFEWDRSIYDGSDWVDRKPGQPFFAQLQTRGGKLRGAHPDSWERMQKKAEKELGSHTPDSAVKLPPYYPAHPDIVRDWAAYLDSVRLTDHMVGQVIARLKKEGELDNTVIIFMTDHGISHARGKQFLYEEGVHVPLIITGPGIQAGTVRRDPVEHIDIVALSLAAAGIPVPRWMQSRDILAKDYQKRPAAFSARDRCDETIDCIRSARSEHFKYIRNFCPQRPYLQPCAYKDRKQILIALREWHEAGRLNEIQLLQFRKTRPEEEFFDLRKDPHELKNLANDPAYQTELARHRQLLNDWIKQSGDQGQKPEPLKQFDSSMAAYQAQVSRRKDFEHLETVRKNIAEARQWRYQAGQ